MNTATTSIDPATTAQALLVGPDTMPEATGVEATLRSLIRSRSTDWITAHVACPIEDYPRLTGDSHQVRVTSTSADAVNSILETRGHLQTRQQQRSSGAPHDTDLIVMLLNDLHPYFTAEHPNGGGTALWEIFRGGRRDSIHLFARSPIKTWTLLTSLATEPTNGTPLGTTGSTEPVYADPTNDGDHQPPQPSKPEDAAQAAITFLGIQPDDPEFEHMVETLRTDTSPAGPGNGGAA